MLFTWILHVEKTINIQNKTKCLAGESNVDPRNTDNQKMTSWAVDDDANEVHELNYFDNLNKKFNKVENLDIVINTFV